MPAGRFNGIGIRFVDHSPAGFSRPAGQVLWAEQFDRVGRPCSTAFYHARAPCDPHPGQPSSSGRPGYGGTAPADARHVAAFVRPEFQFATMPTTSF